MRAYIFDGLPGHPTLAHDSGREVDLQSLTSLGVTARPAIDQEGVDQLAKENGYACRDEITVSRAGLGDAYESKIKAFFEEHMHTDLECRWIREGSGFFDVRDRTDKEWIRVHLEAGDLLVLPPGIYHRFTLDENNYTKAMRLFKEEPKWTPYPRGQDTEVNPYRKEYEQTYLS